MSRKNIITLFAIFVFIQANGQSKEFAPKSFYINDSLEEIQFFNDTTLYSTINNTYYKYLFSNNTLFLCDYNSYGRSKDAGGDTLKYPVIYKSQDSILLKNISTYPLKGVTTSDTLFFILDKRRRKPISHFESLRILHLADGMGLPFQCLIKNDGNVFFNVDVLETRATEVWLQKGKWAKHVLLSKKELDDLIYHLELALPHIINRNDRYAINNKNVYDGAYMYIKICFDGIETHNKYSKIVSPSLERFFRYFNREVLTKYHFFYR